MTAIYLVTRQRWGRWWALEVPALDIYSQARIGFFEVKSMARDAIAVTLDVPADSFDITVVRVHHPTD